MQWITKRSKVQAAEYDYHAFLSYAHEDETSVAWLEKVLANTWVPGKPRRRIYRDKSQIRAGQLSKELSESLKRSRFLIVCCSAATEQSTWVDQEIRMFLEFRRRAGTDPANSILICLVGSEQVLVQLPAAILDIQQSLKDEFYLANLKGAGAPGNSRQRALRHEAMALLAPLVGAPDRETVYALVQKWQRVLSLLVALVILVALTSWAWWRSDRNQVGRAFQAAVPLLAGAAFAQVPNWFAAASYTQDQQEVRATLYDNFTGEDRVAIQRDLAIALAAHSRLPEAAQIAREIDPHYPAARITALSAVIRQSATPDHHFDANPLASEAVNLALNAEPAERDTAMAKVAPALAAVGRTRQALEIINGINSVVLQDVARREVARAFLMAGKVALARDTAMAIGPPPAKAEALSILAAEAELTHPQLRVELAREAVTACCVITEPSTRAIECSVVSGRLATSGLTDLTLIAAKEAISTALTLKGRVEANAVFTNVAKRLAEAGRVEDAMTIANEINDAPLKAGTLGLIARALSGRGEFDRALKVVAAFKNPATAEESLSVVAGAMSRRNPEGAIAIARGLKDPAYYIGAMTEVARSMALLGRTEETKHTLEALISIPRQILADDRRSTAYSQMGVVFAMVGEYRRANQMAGVCTSSSDRLAVYTAIARARAIQQRPNLGRVFANADVIAIDR